jgi:type III secretion protein V
MGRKYGDVILAILVLAITAMLVVPLPTTLLDVLIVTNIAVALLLLFVGLYLPNALALLSFPSLLLLTTLFRLGLNVASTRLILSQGEAGSVIQAFGSFLVRGEVVVGIVIFTIITIVNFIVIARGASRVSEVAARFTLDALPGKQMAIDAELRAGSITVEDARQRREELRKESQLYGSMDGAMKFVQGDAIAGFFIILTNIFGGIYLGVSKGQTFSEAVSTYTILTVGDGLVTQIPALLISICAGIVVTRVASSETTTLSSDIASQVFSNPLTVFLSAVVLVIFGLLPGIPKVPFFAVASVFFLVSYLLRRRPLVIGASGSSLIDFQGNNLPLLPGSKMDEEAQEDNSINLYLDSVWGYKVYRQNALRYSNWWQELRADFYNSTGMKLPELRTYSDDMLGSSAYSIQFANNQIEKQVLIPDALMLEINPENAFSLGINVIKECEHPLSDCRVCWAPNTLAVKHILDAAQIRYFDSFEYVGLRISQFFLVHPEELLTISEVHSSLKALEKKNPGLIVDVLAKNFIDIPRLTEVMHHLVREGFSVRDFKQIVEAVAVYCSSRGVTVSDSDNIDISDLVSHIRVSKRRQLMSRYSSVRGTLRVFTLSSEVEELFEGALGSNEDIGSVLDPVDYQVLKEGLSSLIRPIHTRGLPSVMLVRTELRQSVVKFLNTIEEKAQVITFDELEPRIEVEQIGTWNRLG